ncbi:hypothetical protein P3X46_000775 [Hevea brasiliensis]|uniref:F-box domain-containing protein n=1 Tax=Hevea brasiliensis TaxID=3981 RepID=A0ABQ9NE47_HEVBR|nr:hypothetical protein P3X46_000775 [Hevea brasiliensis]
MGVDYLLKHLVLNILFRLPVICLIRFRCVCKSWCAFFSDPNYIYKNLLSYSDSEDLNANPRVLVKLEDYNPEDFEDCAFSFLSSDTFDLSNLLGLWDDIYDSESNIVLWNPTTTETKILPESNVPRPPHHSISLEIVEFGFDPRTSDCKVLRIFEYLRDDTWRKVDVTLNAWILPSYKYRDGFFNDHRGHTAYPEVMRPCLPLGFSRNGELFFSDLGGQLLVWNPTAEAIARVQVGGRVPWESLQTVTYRESHIPLKGGNQLEDEQNSGDAIQS